MKILMIEDDEDVARATTRMLRSRGYEVVLAPDAIAAISVARNEQPDLVILDLGLPGGGGVTVLNRLRSLACTAATPVIVVTGGASVYDLMELETGGVDAVLVKPVPSADLVAAIESALGATAAS